MIEVTIEGAREALRRCKEITGDCHLAIEEGLFSFANEIMTMSKKLCPVDSGVLRSSGYVTPPYEPTRGDIHVEIGYGGPAEKYAIVQHESLGFRHPSLENQLKGEILVDSDFVPQAKFLETAVFAKTGFLPAHLERAARSHIEAHYTPTSLVRQHPRTPWEGLKLRSRKSKRFSGTPTRRRGKK